MPTNHNAPLFTSALRACQSSEVLESLLLVGLRLIISGIRHTMSPETVVKVRGSGEAQPLVLFQFLAGSQSKFGV